MSEHISVPELLSTLDKLGIAAAPNARGFPDAADLLDDMKVERVISTYQEELLLAGNGMDLAYRNYVAFERLGGGASGIVLKAHDRDSQQLVVAIKRLRVPGWENPKKAEGIRKEVRALQRLDHPNVGRILEFGEQRKTPYLVMEYVEGTSVSKLIKAGQPVDVAEAVSIGIQIAEGLQHIHDSGVYHGDLKSSNVIRSSERTTKIVDFGSAWVSEETTDGSADTKEDTQSTGSRPTAAYMPPEMVDGTVGSASCPGDIYSLGVILFELLTGKLPFAGSSYFALGKQILNADPIDVWRTTPDLPRDIEHIVFQCLQKDWKKRYSSANALAEDLRRFQAGETPHATPISNVSRRVAWVRRHAWQTAFATAVVLSLLMVTAVSVWSNVAIRRERDETATSRDAAVALSGELSKLAVLYSDVGQTEQAQAVLESVSEHLRSISGSELDPPVLHILVTVENNIGKAHRRAGDLELAKEHYRRAFDQCKQLTEIKPGNADYEGTCVLVCTNLANACRDTDEVERALEFYRQAEERLGKIPRDQSSLAEVTRLRMEVFNNRGALYSKQEDRDRAVEQWEQASVTFEKVELGNTITADLLHAYAQSLSNRATISYQAGDRDAAMEVMSRVAEIHAKLLAEQPHVLRYAVSDAIRCNNNAELDFRAGRVHDSLEWRDRAAEILKGVLAKENRNSKARKEYCLAHMGKGECLIALKQFSQSTSAWQIAFRFDTGTNRQAIIWGLTYSMVRSGTYKEAIGYLESQFVESNASMAVRYNTATTYAQGVAAVMSDAQLPMEERKTLAEEYGQKAVQLLVPVCNRSDLNDLRTSPEFKPIRQREDFQQMIRRLEGN